jgi:hypothetical protein
MEVGVELVGQSCRCKSCAPQSGEVSFGVVEDGSQWTTGKHAIWICRQLAGAKEKQGSDTQLLLLLSHVGLYHNSLCSRWPAAFHPIFAVLRAASIDHTAHNSLSPNNHAHVMAPTRHRRPAGSLLRPACQLDAPQLAACNPMTIAFSSRPRR